VPEVYNIRNIPVFQFKIKLSAKTHLQSDTVRIHVHEKDNNIAMSGLGKTFERCFRMSYEESHE